MIKGSVSVTTETSYLFRTDTRWQNKVCSNRYMNFWAYDYCGPDVSLFLASSFDLVCPEPGPWMFQWPWDAEYDSEEAHSDFGRLEGRQGLTGEQDRRKQLQRERWRTAQPICFFLKKFFYTYVKVFWRLFFLYPEVTWDRHVTRASAGLLGKRWKASWTLLRCRLGRPPGARQGP